MRLIRLLCLIIVAPVIFFTTCSVDDLILIEDFESPLFGEWIADGDAFGEGVELSHWMVGVMGERFAASMNRSSAQGTGTLTSPLFSIRRNHIYFLLGAHEIHFLQDAQESSELAVQLLIDDEVVRTTIPSKFHAMFWESWEVKEFKGKSARIRIVDNDGRRWAHIDVDHFVQSNIPADRPPFERTVTVTKPSLNFPIKQGAPRCYMELIVDGEQVRALEVELANDDIDYWVVTDLSPWMGKDILIRSHLPILSNPKSVDRIVLEDGIRDAADLYREALRPQYHFSSKRGWINDPNGLVFYNGEYHLFYQHNPFGWDHSRDDVNKTWGHAVSTDLVHWTELPAAIHPDHLGPIYSGSSVVDENNTTGFQTGKEKPLVCVFTSAGGRSPWSEGRLFTQSIAYSNDRGRTFTMYEGNPVLENIEYVNRDPKAIWHKPTNQWVIVLHFDERAMAFFTSEDLKSWKFQSELVSGVLQDCPELFQLPVDGDEQNKKWILYGGSGHYFVGEFNGKKYSPETREIQFSYGNCFYASQTFSNIPEEDGRRIQMAWGTIPTQGMPFNQILLFPVELSLRTTDEGLRMYAYPVEEIKGIYGEEYTWIDEELAPGQNILSNVVGDLFDIDAEFDIGEADEFGFQLNGLPVAYNVESNELYCGNREVELEPIDGKIRLRILVDRVSIEIFANDGRVYMPIRAIHRGEKRGIEVFTKGGTTRIRSLKVHKLKSIWN